MEQAVAVNKELIALLSSALGWIGFLTVLLILRSIMVKGISLGAAQVILNSDKTTQAWLIKHLVSRNITLKEIYLELRAEEVALENKEGGK